MKTQLVGPLSFRGMNMKAEELEYMLGKVSRTDFGITVIVNFTDSIIFLTYFIKKLSFSKQTGAIETSIKSDPTPQVKDVMMSSLRNGGGGRDDDSSDDNDW